MTTNTNNLSHQYSERLVTPQPNETDSIVKPNGIVLDILICSVVSLNLNHIRPSTPPF